MLYSALKPIIISLYKRIAFYSVNKSKFYSRCVPLLILFATLANGLPSYLRKIGLIDRAAYLDDLYTFCEQPINFFWLPNSCHFRSIVSTKPLEWITIDIGRIYSLTALEMPLKLFKYIVVVVIFVTSIGLINKHENRLLSIRQATPLLPLLFLTVFAFIHSCSTDGLLVALAGSISSFWVFLVPICSWITIGQGLARICDVLALIIFSLLPLAVVEAMLGLPAPFGASILTLTRPNLPIPSRLSQIFVQPNSLGGFLIVSLAFCYIFSSRRKLLPYLTVSVIPLLLLARSGTGIFSLAVLLSFSFLSGSKLGISRSINLRIFSFFSILLILCLSMYLLPFVTGRADLFRSVAGRVEMLASTLKQVDLISLLFGQGSARAGSLIQQIHEAEYPLASSFPILHNLFPAPEQSESTLQSLLIQQGVFGVLAFYGLIIHQSIQYNYIRPLFIVLVLTSLTLKLGEVFPIYLLLAFSLNHSLRMSRLVSS